MDTDGLKKLLSVEKIDCHGCSGRFSGRCSGKEMAADFSRPWALPGRGLCQAVEFAKLPDRFLDRGAVTWPAVSKCAFAGMWWIFEKFHRKQRGIGEEFPA